VKCITTVVTGLLVGLLAVALGRITETTIILKNTVLRSIVHGPGYSLQWGMFLGTAFHVGYSVLLVVIGSSLVCSGCPFCNTLCCSTLTALALSNLTLLHHALFEAHNQCYVMWKVNFMSHIVLAERRVVLLQVQFVAPVANGAGVSLIMAYLNGNSIPDLLTFRSANQMYTYDHLQSKISTQACTS
jgi:hypothetical protein